MEHKQIQLENGYLLDVECSEEFYTYVRKFYNVPQTTFISDEQIKNFFYATYKNALAKEEENNNI